MFNYLPYSLDLAPCDFSLSRKLTLKGYFFNDISAIKTAITRTLEAIPQNELQHAFESLFNRCNKYIETREYFEHKNRKMFRYLVSMMFPTASLETYLSHCVV